MSAAMMIAALERQDKAGEKVPVTREGVMHRLGGPCYDDSTTSTDIRWVTLAQANAWSAHRCSACWGWQA